MHGIHSFIHTAFCTFSAFFSLSAAQREEQHAQPHKVAPQPAQPPLLPPLPPTQQIIIPPRDAQQPKGTTETAKGNQTAGEEEGRHNPLWIFSVGKGKGEEGKKGGGGKAEGRS